MAANGQQLQKREDAGELIERLIAVGDLSKLTSIERSQYYGKVCESVGLNPFTRPFEYITLNGKLTLYARKDATDQLRKIHSVSVQIVSRERIEDVYVVTARATDRNGRSDESIGAVSVGKIGGDALCNALMKAETKAKRRVTLSICGLGLLDESETETIPAAKHVTVSPDGEIVEASSLSGTEDQWACGAQLQRQVIDMELTASEKENKPVSEYRSKFRTQRGHEVWQGDASEVQSYLTWIADKANPF